LTIKIRKESAMISHDELRRLLDFLVARPRLGAAMQAIGHAEKTIFALLKKSAAGDPRLVMSWPKDSEARPFHELVVEARRKNVIVFEAAMRSEALEGIPRVVLHDGEIQYQRDPRFVGWSDADMVALGFDLSQRYLRDKNGNAIPLVVMDSAPAHLKIHMLKSLIPQTYGEKKTLDVNNRINGSVMVLGATPVESRPVLDAQFAEALPAPIEADDGEPHSALEMAAEDAEPELPEWAPTPAEPPVAPPRPAPARGFRVAAG
jgi:hypothetical protein